MYCYTLQVFGSLMQSRVFMLCSVENLPLQRVANSARNLNAYPCLHVTPQHLCNIYNTDFNQTEILAMSQAIYRSY
jgi:hypothetical protein